MRPRILLVDDDSHNLYLLAKIVRPYGRVETAMDGKKAIALFKEGLERGDRFHILFLDIIMPGLSGREVLRVIRDHESIWMDLEDMPTTVVMASGITEKEVIQQSLKEGSEFFMTKPFRVEQVRRIMDQLGLEAESAD
ncbi:MAG: response regulator [bacterium]|nr:response regulator [bacterium]